MNISSRHFIKEKDLVTRCVADETIIVPVRNNVGDLDSIYTLNEVATTIWQLIDGRKSVSQIVETLCNTYEVTPEEATKGTVDFLNSLEKGGLIRTIENKKE